MLITEGHALSAFGVNVNLVHNLSSTIEAVLGVDRCLSMCYNRVCACQHIHVGWHGYGKINHSDYKDKDQQ
jgi:hypothetical protein